MAQDLHISDEEFDALLSSVPASYSTRKAGVEEVSVETLVTDYGPIDAPRVQAMIDYVEGSEPLGVAGAELKAIRHTHHKLAQLLAGGIDETIAAKLCNYSVARVSILKSDPAFRDLLTHYTTHVQEEFADFVSVAADLGLDALQELQARLDEKPESFSNTALMELVKTTADRTGNGPMAKSMNLNINANLGDRLKAARERANAAALLARTG